MLIAGGGLSAGGQAYIGKATSSGKPDIRFDKDGVETLIAELTKVRMSLRQAQRSSWHLERASEPGHTAADCFAMDVQNFGSSYARWNEEYSKAVSKTVDQLKKVIEEYEGREDDEARRFNKGLSD